MEASVYQELKNIVESLKPVRDKVKNGKNIDSMGLTYVQASHMRFSSLMKQVDESKIDKREQELVNEFKNIYSDIERYNDRNIASDLVTNL